MGRDLPAKSSPGSETLLAYEDLAPYYDSFTDGYEYTRWLDAIEIWAQAHGLRGRRLLDVACGTGKSFEPMLARGYRVTACDLSPQMVVRARDRARDRADVRVADMRSLPWESSFDLVTCMDDAVNYLLTPDHLAAALSSIAKALAPGGVLVFDTNTLRTYRTTFASTFDVPCGSSALRWHGLTTSAFEAGDIATAVIASRGGERLESRHVQRHWPISVLRAATLRAGLERVSFRGQVPGGRLVGDPDELNHTKVVCIAAKPRTPCRTVPQAATGREGVLR